MDITEKRLTALEALVKPFVERQANISWAEEKVLKAARALALLQAHGLLTDGSTPGGYTLPARSDASMYEKGLRLTLDMEIAQLGREMGKP